MTDRGGFIVTFYSYKGGVGRTMAVANIAVLLAQRGLNTLAVDFDLEAPGLHRYFQGFGVSQSDANEGMLDILVAARDGIEIAWRERLINVDLRGPGRLSVLTSGRHDEGYPQRVLDFNWRDFFEQRDGGRHIEELRDEWRAEFDIALVDSRTGITDSGGVCTIQLPDVLVPMFTANEQSVQGCRDVAVAAQQARQNLAFDRPPLLVFPLPSRFDARAQYKESRTWLKTFAKEFGDFYNTWLPTSVSPLKVLERTKLPYVAYFSFGEKLPVVTEGTSDPEGLGYAFATAATLIAGEFNDVETVLFGGPLQSDPVESSFDVLLAEWDRRVARNAHTHRLAAERGQSRKDITRIAFVLLTIAGLVGAAVLGSAALAIGTLALALLAALLYPRESGGIAKHEAAAASWDAIGREIVEARVQSASGNERAEEVDAIRKRIDALEASAPATDAKAMSGRS